MSSLSTNLLAAWGDGDSEPDPSTLPGLLAIAETRLEESVESFRALLGHFESIQQRVWEAKNNLEEMLAKAGQLPKEMAEAGQDNLEAFDELVGLLEELLALEPDEELDTYWEALGAFEECSESIRAANTRLIEATKSAES